MWTGEKELVTMDEKLGINMINTWLDLEDQIYTQTGRMRQQEATEIDLDKLVIYIV